MPSEIQNILIRASAGSGKTWQLSNRFLALLAIGVAPEKLIALTFTKKAAAEFTQRILMGLAKASSSPKHADKLRQELLDCIHGTEHSPALLSESPRLSEAFDLAFFQKKLFALTSHLDKLALFTLDSFLSRLLSGTQMDFGLAGFDILDEEHLNEKKSQALHLALQSKKRQQLFIKAFLHATEGRRSTRISKELNHFIAHYHQLLLSAPDKRQWGKSTLLADFPAPPSSPLEDCAQEVELLLDTIPHLHKGYANSWKSAYLYITENKKTKLPARLESALPHLKDLLKGEDFVEIFSKREQVISGALAKAIGKLLYLWIEKKIEQLNRQTQGLYTLTHAYEDVYHHSVRRLGFLGFSDLSFFLKNTELWKNHLDILAYRLDARYLHWLLDEFQDTSLEQWQSIFPFIDEIIQDNSGERSLFIVGDEKQSLYGWRGAKPALLHSIESYYRSAIHSWRMDQSYRSSAEVLDFVNTVFTFDSTQDWSSLFSAKTLNKWTFLPHQPATQRWGILEVLQTSSPSENSPHLARYEATQRLLERLLPLHHGLSCAILVPKNSQVSALFDFLRTHMPDVPISAQSKRSLIDSPLGALFYDLFYWLIYPRHMRGYIQLALSPFHALFDYLPPQALWKKLYKRLQEKGITTLCRELIDAIANATTLSTYGNNTLNALRDACGTFEKKGGGLNAWVLLLKSQKLNASSQKGMIEIMTFHQSKGLGFDLVILPELEDSLDKKSANALQSFTPQGEIEYLIKRPSKEVLLAIPALHDLQQKEREENDYDRLATLYVALTRAVHGTFCILDETSKNKRSFSSWIKKSLPVEPPVALDSNVTQLYKRGNYAPRIQPLRQDPPPCHLTSLPPPSPLYRETLASHADESRVAWVNASLKEAIDFGKQVHAIFESITWLDSFFPLQWAGIVSPEAISCVEACLAIPAIQAFFLPPQGHCELYCEQSFEVLVKGTWIGGIIDRLLVYYKNKVPVKATIIDFKTDATHDANLLISRHKEQMLLYQQAIARILNLPEQAVATYLISTSQKQVLPALTLVNH